MPRSGRELYDFQGVKVHETKDALLLKVWVIGGDQPGEKNEWFPKSVIEDNGDGTYTIPMKWAHDKGLV